MESLVSLKVVSIELHVSLRSLKALNNSKIKNFAGLAVYYIIIFNELTDGLLWWFFAKGEAWIANKTFFWLKVPMDLFHFYRKEYWFSSAETNISIQLPTAILNFLTLFKPRMTLDLKILILFFLKKMLTFLQMMSLILTFLLSCWRFCISRHLRFRCCLYFL